MLVLNYNPPCLDTAQVEKRKILEFMAELRKLFSLLLNSQRKYVDPSKAVGILRGSLGGGGDAAQGEKQVFSLQMFSTHGSHNESDQRQ